jgi:hypothetical protein
LNILIVGVRHGNDSSVMPESMYRIGQASLEGDNAYKKNACHRYLFCCTKHTDFYYLFFATLLYKNVKEPKKCSCEGAGIPPLFTTNQKKMQAPLQKTPLYYIKATH